MPLFICISGYFTHYSNNQKFFKSIANVFIVFLANHVLRIAYGYFVNGVFSFERLWWSYYGLWYLVALMIYRVIYQYGHKIIEKRAVIIFVLSFVVSLVWGFVDTNVMTAGQRIINFFPYFILGIIGRQYDLFNKAKRIPWHWGVIMFAVAFASFFFINEDIHRLLWLELPYSYLTLHPILQVIVKIFQLLASIVLSAFLIGIVNSMKLSFHIDTLFVYIWHLWILKPLAKMVISHFDVPQNIYSAIICMLITLGILALMSRVPFVKSILKPIKNRIYIYHFANSKKNLWNHIYVQHNDKSNNKTKESHY